MGAHSFTSLLAHVGHDIQVARYGSDDDVVNVAIECMDCYTVLADYDRNPQQEEEAAMNADQLNAATDAFETARRSLAEAESALIDVKQEADRMKASEANVAAVVAADKNFTNDTARKAEIARRVAMLPDREDALMDLADAERDLIVAKANVSSARERLATARLIFAAAHGVTGIVSGGE